MDDTIRKIKYLDRILNNIDTLSEELNILQGLKCLKFNCHFENFSTISKILKLIKNLKLSIRLQISQKLISDNSYLDRYETNKLIDNYNIKYNPTKITNNYKFNPNYKNEFKLIKKEIEKIIKKIPKIKKIKMKNDFINYNTYCSDYVDRNINKYVLNKMNQFKIYFLSN